MLKVVSSIPGPVKSDTIANHGDGLLVTHFGVLSEYDENLIILELLRRVNMLLNECVRIRIVI